MRTIIVVICHLCACLVPLMNSPSKPQTMEGTFHGWPTEFQGTPITPLPLTDKERGFSRNFPGKIGRFSDGEREIIMRYVERTSRKVHPSADCLLGTGYSIKPQPLKRDHEGHLWGCVLAEREGLTYRVCERIYDESGQSWYDVSSWFWSVLLQRNNGPWWAVTVAEKV